MMKNEPKHAQLVAYLEFRRHVMGYKESGKQMWQQIKSGCVRSAVTWDANYGNIRDMQYPTLLVFFLNEYKQ